MAGRLVECVPNFSEGRDAAALDAIAAAILSAPGAALLDRHLDPDHNRAVLTLAGSPGAVLEAAVRGAAAAVKRIDLNRHRGVHPRIGALDVLPFVPLEGSTLEECAELAVRAGERLWSELGVPVYLYGAAARRAERVNLANVRRGQFERLREEAPLHPHRSPDIGGPALHPTAGATAAGARTFLIAFNVNLATPDAGIAQRIAARIRESSGGLPHVRAMGVPLVSRRQAQVSMNLTDFERTSLSRAYEAVLAEAARLGVAVAGAEIVGLVPRRALQGFAAADFSTRILEDRAREALGRPSPEESGAG